LSAAAGFFNIIDMAITKKQKEKIINDLKEMFSRQKAIILIGITGLKVKDISLLRKKIKLINGNLKVAKKTLMKIVFKENNLEFDRDKFKEEVALVFGFNDESATTKTIYQFSKENEKLKILGGYFDGSFKKTEEMIILAELPPKEELITRLVGGLKSPISNFVNVLKSNIKGLMHVLSNIKT
jgi:large subunit ribosomal protein L10